MSSVAVTGRKQSYSASGCHSSWFLFDFIEQSEPMISDLHVMYWLSSLLSCLINMLCVDVLIKPQHSQQILSRVSPPSDGFRESSTAP